MSRRLERLGAALVGAGSLGVVLVSHPDAAGLHQSALGFAVHGAHHAAHLALVGVASIVFACFVARDIAQHGWPRFAWRL